MESSEMKLTRGAVLAEPLAVDAELIAMIAQGSASGVIEALARGASPDAIIPSRSAAARLVERPQTLNKPALMLALELCEDLGVARALLAAGASPNAKAFGATALDIAIERRPEFCVDLIEAGADIHDRSQWSPPAIAAVKHGQLGVYKALVAKGASPKGVDWKGKNGPMCAASWGQLPMLAHLLAQNQWEDKPRKLDAMEKRLGESPPLEPRAYALHPDAAWGSHRALGEIAAALIDAARAIRAERTAERRAAESKKGFGPARPIGLAALYARAEADGFDLIRRSAALMASGGEPGHDEQARKKGELKAREWMASLLATHPSWRLEGPALDRALSALEPWPEASPAKSSERLATPQQKDAAAPLPPPLSAVKDELLSRRAASSAGLDKGPATSPRI